MTEERQEYLERVRREREVLRRFVAMQKSQKEIVGCQKIYVDVTGDLEAALVLDELLFFTLPQEDKTISALRVWKDGFLWMAVPRSEWWDRKRLKERQADLAIQKLLDQDLIIKKVSKFKGLSCVHIRLNIPVFFKKYFAALEEANPPEDDSDTINHDLADLYEMMGIKQESELQIGDSQNGELQNGDGVLPNGETFNIPHSSPTEEEGFSSAYSFFIENFGAPTVYDYQLLGDMCKEHTEHWVVEAMKVAVKRGARSLAYVDKVLKRWKVDGYGTAHPKGNDRNPDMSYEEALQKAGYV